MATSTRRSPAPRLVTKILGFSFGVIVAVLVTVFLLLTWQTRERLTRVIVANLESSQQRVAEVESRRRAEHRLQASALAQDPTLTAAVDAYHAERLGGGGATSLAVNTIRLELANLQAHVQAPALTVTDVGGMILASVGDHADDWGQGDHISADVPDLLEPVDAVIDRGAAVYAATLAPVTFGPDVIGELVLASPVDGEYARQLARETSTDIVVSMGERIIASSLPEEQWEYLAVTALPEDGTVDLDDDEYVVRQLMALGPVRVHAFGAIGAPVRAATAEAAVVFLLIGCGALLLAAAGSWWLARTLAAPIEDLRQSLQHMAEARDFEQPLAGAGTSCELDALTDTFDRLRAAVAAAEAESEAAYLGVIGALAAALDARDPYTAGHSERVAKLSVSIGRAMGMSEPDLETLHLGALLHDIGKIGVSDLILRKPGTLTDEEFDQVKKHPTLGARILKPLHFLAEQVAIVELHHEQPDGHGYPYGLRASEIPVPARIVHVADAFDAMTSARAYRPGRPAHEAIANIRRHAGTLFDRHVVQAMTSLPQAELPVAPGSPASESATGALEQPVVGGLLVPFRLRATSGGRPRRATG